MCGIVGIRSFYNKVHKDVLIAMRDSLTYRGPDDAGIYIDEQCGIGLGHRRLSILDLSPLGHQPMSNESGSIWITFNGEIYNFQEIKEELVEKGYRFRSNSDTEVVVKAYEEWDMDCVHKFIGMFAIGIWDRRKKMLYLLRDRAGVKPLYYYYRNGVFLFASELKALMHHPDFEKGINFQVLPLYLQYGYIPAPYSILENVYKLRQGHYLSLSENGEVNEIKYWDIVDFYLGEPISESEETIEEELEALLIDSFKYRLISDVPVGIFLSGGVDSTTVTALLQKNTNTTLKTFSIGFFEKDFNEGETAKGIAKYLETEHTEYYLHPSEALSIVQKLPEIYDEPMADSSAIPTYLVSKLAREKVTVVLSGEGGDELFCGYSRFSMIDKFNKFLLSVPAQIRGPLIKVIHKLNPKEATTLYNACKFVLPKMADFNNKYIRFRSILNESNFESLENMYRIAVSIWPPRDLYELTPYSSKELSNSTYFEDTFSRLRSLNSVTQMMAVDFKVYLADDVLTKLDRATMSVSLEGREPFLDHRLVEYVARLPLSFKYRNGKGKYILRKVLYKYVPKELMERYKQGFSVPLYEWFRKPELSRLLTEYLNEDRIKRDAIFNTDTVNGLLKSYLDGTSVNANKLWSLLMFEMWRERWF